MEEVQPELCGSARIARGLNRGTRGSAHDGSAGVTDCRLARLLLVLSEIDETVARIGGMPERELRGLVSGAIQACGFSDPAEMRWVVASVLQAIDAHQASTMYVP